MIREVDNAFCFGREDTLRDGKRYDACSGWGGDESAFPPEGGRESRNAPLKQRRANSVKLNWPPCFFTDSWGRAGRSCGGRRYEGEQRPQALAGLGLSSGGKFCQGKLQALGIPITKVSVTAGVGQLSWLYAQEENFEALSPRDPHHKSLCNGRWWAIEL